MILGLLSLVNLSTYDLSIKINNLAEVPTMTLAAILFPQSAKRAGTEGIASAKYLYEKSVGILLAIILPVVIVILLGADIIVHIIGSEKIRECCACLTLNDFYGVFYGICDAIWTILDSVGKPKLNFFNYHFVCHYELDV